MSTKEGDFVKRVSKGIKVLLNKRINQFFWTPVRIQKDKSVLVVV